ncbi:MAG: hypothetical protein IPP71_08500 [Bacteroidetes bacterium]|nr:hypothetical protein [Bacteroidota bacterium]
MTIAAFQPTIVATGIITNALFLYHQFSGNTKSLDLCKSACEFILHDINQTIDPDGSVCFSYSPFDKIRVFNASMKGVRALSQVYSVTQKSELAETALKGVRFVMKQQKPNGSWNYAEGKNGAWVDNYHTGYVLDCLNDYMKNTGDYSWQSNQQKGFDYYSNTFFQEGEIPKFFNNATYPIDCTAGGQSLLTFVNSII